MLLIQIIYPCLENIKSFKRSPSNINTPPGLLLECGPSLKIKLFQSFQRIQRNRQSRIRVKLYRRAGKRPDEILEEENNTAEDDIDIIGGVKDTDADFDGVKKPDVKLNPKRSVYGPDQFTEADVLAVAQELEKEDPAKPGQEEEPMSGDDDDGSKSDSCQKKRCSQCQVSQAARPGAELLFI